MENTAAGTVAESNGIPFSSQQGEPLPQNYKKTTDKKQKQLKLLHYLVGHRGGFFLNASHLADSIQIGLISNDNEMVNMAN